MKKWFSLLLAAALGGELFAAQVTVTPIRPEGIYRCSEPGAFTIYVCDDQGNPVKDGEVKLTMSKDFKFTGNYTELTRTLAAANPVIVTVESSEPGLVRCTAEYVDADGKSFVRSGAVAFEPEKIRKSTPAPEDLKAYWDAQKARVMAIDLDAQLERREELSTPEADGYAISLANIDGSRAYGYISIPKAEGKYPVLLNIPGAGPGFSSVPADVFPRDKVIIAGFNVHNYAVEPATADAKYAELNKNGMYMYHGMPVREKYYFNRAILGLVQAVRYLTGLPKWNGNEFVVWGSSQGGAMTLAASALNPEIVTAAAVNVPAMCDFTTAMRGGYPAWPVSNNTDVLKDQAKTAMLEYFDMANLAAWIQCPIIFGVGWMDSTCPAEGIYAAYNNIQSPKSIWNSLYMGHAFDPNNSIYREKWLKGQLGLEPAISPTK